jgi:hypothetical protein
LVTAAWALVMNALLVNVAPLTVAMLPDCAATTSDLSVGTAPLVIVVDVELLLVVVAVTDVIFPPDTVIDTATVPYWCVTVPPANVPSFIPPAGAAVVALAVVAGAFVAAAAVVAALAAAVVPAFAAADEAAALAAADDWAATAADC